MSKREEIYDTTPWRAYTILRVDSGGGKAIHIVIPSENYWSARKEYGSDRASIAARYICQSASLAMRLFEMAGFNCRLKETGFQVTRDCKTDRVHVLDENGEFVFDLSSEFNPRNIVDTIKVYRAGIEAGKRIKTVAIRDSINRLEVLDGLDAIDSLEALA